MAPVPSSPLPAPAAPRPAPAFIAAILLMYSMDVLLLGRHSVGLAGLRIGWALSLLLHRWVMCRLAPERQRQYGAILGVQEPLWFAGLVTLSGGTGSPYFEFFLLTPTIIAFSYPNILRVALIAGAVSLGGTLLLAFKDGATVLEALGWCAIVATGTLVGVHSIHVSRAGLEAKARARAERDQRESIEQLARETYHRTQTERLLMLGRLAANVMHELNNPLAFVRSNMAFLREQVLDNPQPDRRELEELLSEVDLGLDRIQRIASDLRSFSRMDDEEPPHCALQQVVADATRIASLRLKHVAQLRVELPAQLPQVAARPRRLAQVLLNLLVNAGDALEAAHNTQGEVAVRAWHQAGVVVLVVEDNGPGFPPQVLEHLFQPFFTTKGPDKGTGLGLSLSRELVEQCGGSLIAENRQEGGARMRLTLRALQP